MKAAILASLLSSLLITSTLAISLSGKAQLSLQSGSHHLQRSVVANVFTTTNSDDAVRGNEVLMYNQMNDGTLDLIGRFPTGGEGSGNLPGGTTDPLGSQAPLVVDEDRHHLLSVNALSNTVTLFKIHEGLALEQMHVAPSGGDFPVSITISQDGKFVYVLNAGGTSSVSILEKRNDRLVPLQLIDLPNQDAGNPPNINFTPGQVGLAFEDTKLIVVMKDSPEIGGANNGRFLVYDLDESTGALADANADPVATEIGSGLFSMNILERDGRAIIIGTDPFLASSSSYELQVDGVVEPIAQYVGNGNQIAPCWNTYVGNFSYITNAVPGTISSYRIEDDFSLTLLESEAISPVSGGFPIDIASNDNYVYQLFPGTGSIGVYEIDSDTGALRRVGHFADLPPFPIEAPAGLAVYTIH